MTNDITQAVENFFTPYPIKTFLKGELLVQAGETPSGVFFLQE